MPMSEFTGLILAGGKSSRMGQNKALLQLDGKSLLQWQADKLRLLGVGEILISAREDVSLPGIRTVPDGYPGCGPIGGLHAGLSAAKHQRCIVLSVDCPLIPVQALSGLCRAHQGGITILRHSGGQEPLLAVYDRSVVPHLEHLIRQGVYAIRDVWKQVPVLCWEYTGPAELLCNCNRPEDLEQARRYLADAKEGTCL